MEQQHTIVRPNIRKPQKSQPPHGVKYVVLPCGVWWEVRRQIFDCGQLKFDQSVAAYREEPLAEELARKMAEAED